MATGATVEDDTSVNDTTQTSVNRSEAPNGDSQTASEYIKSQLQLEAEAREALPYSFDHCTKPLGPLRQNIYSCLTCNPPPEDLSQPYDAAGICYGCSIACHGEHTLVELFAHRDFTCDCGTTRFPAETPCTLRINSATGIKEPVHSEEAFSGNTYNRNFRNHFCGCGELYDAHKQKGTMYQCIGLSTEQDGGCGEDWWHPECLKGWPRDWHLSESAQKLGNNDKTSVNGEGEEHPIVPGFREDFESLICYKCVDANPWIKKYATSDGFMVLPNSPLSGDIDAKPAFTKTEPSPTSNIDIKPETQGELLAVTKKRKAEDGDSETESTTSKRAKVESDTISESKPKHTLLPPAPTGTFSILALDDNFRDHFCRCAACYPILSKFPQLLEEEDVYVPPESSVSGAGDDLESVGTKSLLERGEVALSNMDRVRAIEGVMAYNHLRDKVKSFLKPFAESGEAVSADHIKAYFEKLRGDDQAMREAAAAVPNSTSNDRRREESSK